MNMLAAFFSGWEGQGRKVALLAICWSLAVSGSVILVSVSALTGHLLVDDKSLATLPIAFQWAGTALASLPASLLMRRIGRRGGFAVGCLVGLAGAGVCMLAIYWSNFWLFCAGIALLGAYVGFNAFYRFAAADSVSPANRARAISLVLFGGVIASVGGPLIARGTVDLFLPHAYMGAFFGMGALAVAVLAMLTFIPMPPPPAEDLAGPQRPLSEIARRPAFFVAVMGGAIGYGVMVLLMSVTPLAMKLHQHTFSDSAFVIQWHVLGMFAPALFTGLLIRRFGVLEIMLTGVAMLLACIAVAVSGLTVVHFWAALVLLGLGWNFCFVGGSTLLTEVHTPAEKAKVQGLNDMLVFTSAGVASFFSGNLLHNYGWETLNLAALPLVLAVGMGTLWLLVRRRRRRAAMQPG